MKGVTGGPLKLYWELLGVNVELLVGGIISTSRPTNYKALNRVVWGGEKGQCYVELLVGE